MKKAQAGLGFWQAPAPRGRKCDWRKFLGWLTGSESLDRRKFLTHALSNRLLKYLPPEHTPPSLRFAWALLFHLVEFQGPSGVISSSFWGRFGV
jgi:hypothetical protein